MACQVVSHHFLRQADPIIYTAFTSMNRITHKPLILKQRLQIESPNLMFLLSFRFSGNIQIFVDGVLQPDQDKSAEHPSENRKQHGSREMSQTNFEVLFFAECVSVYTHELRNVIAANIMAKQELLKTFTDRTIQRLTELAEKLERFNIIVDKILTFFASKSLIINRPTECPTIEELKGAKDAIDELKGRLKLNALEQVFKDFSIETTRENILASILGLNIEIGEWLYNLNPSLREHQTELYHICSFIENREAMLGADNKLTEVTSVNSLTLAVEELGFTKKQSQIIAESVCEDFICMQKASFWALRYLQHTYHGHPLLLVNCPRYQYQEDKHDEWFMQEVVQASANEDKDEMKTVRMINIADKTQKTRLVEEFLKQESDEFDKDYTFLFHGTEHLGAKSILNHGIDIDQGMPRQDFFDGCGFYLSDAYKFAKQWAIGGDKTVVEKWAVMVFKIPNHMLENNKHVDLEDTTITDWTWEEVVENCRNGTARKWKKDIRMKNICYIKGRHCKNPLQVNKSRPAVRNFNLSEQFCLCDHEFAERFGVLSNVAAVIFF